MKKQKQQKRIMLVHIDDLRDTEDIEALEMLRADIIKEREEDFLNWQDKECIEFIDIYLHELKNA